MLALYGGTLGHASVLNLRTPVPGTILRIRGRLEIRNPHESMCLITESRELVMREPGPRARVAAFLEVFVYR